MGTHISTGLDPLGVFFKLGGVNLRGMPFLRFPSARSWHISCAFWLKTPQKVSTGDHKARTGRQLSAHFDSEGCIQKVRTLTAEAAANGAQLILFPEAFIPAYPRGLSFGTVVGLWEISCIGKK